MGFLFFVSPFCRSLANANDPTPFIEKALKQKLFKESFWLNLGHYRKEFWSKNLRSDVRSPEFFLAGQGKSDPALELAATIEKLFANFPGEKPDQHAICQFPARFKWLSEKLQLPFGLEKLQSCPRYMKWTNRNRIDSVSILFATGYLGNPASYFGHPLIKLNYGTNQSDLLDNSLNYGALTPDGENPIVYIFKGVGGGYDAAFSDIEFYYHHHNYANTELRDMWEYRLNLTRNEVERIVDHAWEMLGIKIPYYFFSDNCAYRMAELLALAVEQNILSPNSPYAIPNTLFHNLMNIRTNSGESLVKSIDRIPSLFTVAAKKYQGMQAEEKKVAKQLALNAEHLQSADYSSLDFDKKARVVEFAMDYYSYKLAGDGENNKLKQDRKKFVLARMDLPPGNRFQLDYKDATPPHKGPRSFMTRFKQVHDKQNENYFEFEFRTSLYDYLSPPGARSRNSELTTAATVLRVTDDQVKIRRFDIFSIGKLDPAVTDLPGDNTLAWQVKFGAFAQDLLCSSCTVWGVEGGPGYVVQVASFLSVYAIGLIHVQTDRRQVGTLATTPRLGAFLDPHPIWRTHFFVGDQKFHNESKLHKKVLEIENRISWSANWDLRLGYLEDVDRQTRLSFSYYW